MQKSINSAKKMQKRVTYWTRGIATDFIATDCHLCLQRIGDAEARIFKRGNRREGNASAQIVSDAVFRLIPASTM